MGPEPPSRTSLDSRLSCVAKTISCFRKLRSSFGSPFPPISSSAVRKVHTSRSLYDYPEVAVGPGEQRCRVVVATHPAGPKKSRVGVALPKKERLPRISRTCPEYRKRSTGSREKTLPSLWHSKGLELRAVLELFFSREQIFSLPVDILPFTLSNDAA